MVQERSEIVEVTGLGQSGSDQGTLSPETETGLFPTVENPPHDLEQAQEAENTFGFEPQLRTDTAALVTVVPAPFEPRVVPVAIRAVSSARTFRLLQEWEGVVQWANDREFGAVLNDLTDRKNPPEETVLSVEDTSPDDIALIVPGAVFYLSIGYETNASGQRKRVAVIRFRRLPAWTKRDLREIEARTSELEELFGWTNEKSDATVGKPA